MTPEKEKDTIFVGTFVKPSVKQKIEEIRTEKKWSRALLLRTIIEAYVDDGNNPQ
jgi:hypothetical protein